MQKKIDTSIIKRKITQVLKEQDLRVFKIILFGSRARGNFEEDSDWDILIVLSENLTQSNRRKVWNIVYKTLHKYFPYLSFDIIIESIEKFGEEKNIANTISNEAYLEGIEL